MPSSNGRNGCTLLNTTCSCCAAIAAATFGCGTETGGGAGKRFAKPFTGAAEFIPTFEGGGTEAPGPTEGGETIGPLVDGGGMPPVNIGGGAKFGRFGC